MARLQGKMVVTESYISEKTGVQYLTLVDLDHGGQLKISFRDVSVDVRPGLIVDVDLTVAGRLDTAGGVRLGYIDGTFHKSEGGEK